MSRWRTSVRTVVAGALLAGVGVAVTPEVARAEVALPPDPSWVTNVSQGNNRDDGFKVKAMVKLGNVVYIGGGFTQIAPDNKAFSPSGGPGGNPNQAGIDQPYLFAVDATTGEAIQTFRPKLNAPVEALEVGPNNTVYVGGTFTTANGVPLNGFAILDGSTGLLKNGVVQRSFANNADPGSVWAIELYGSLLYVGGNFTTVQNCGLASCNRGKVARFSIATPASALDGFQVYLSGGGKVQAMAVDVSNPTFVYVGGQFSGARTSSGGAPVAGTGFLAAFRQDNAALVTTWAPSLTPPPPGPGGVVRPPEVRGLAASANVVYAGVGGGGGRFYAINGATGAASYRRTYNTDGDVQAVAITPQGDRVFVGGHFTRVDTPHTSIPVGVNARCQMFSVTTAAGHAIQATPNTSNGGHYGPFAVIADSQSDTWWGGQLTVFANGWVQDDDPPGTNPVATSCGTGDQKNKIGQTSAGYVGGIAHLRSNPGFADVTAPSQPTITTAGPGIFNGVNLTWSAAADNVKVTAYYIRATGPGLLEPNQVVGTQWGTDLGFSIPPARLSPNATYQMRVCAVDLGDNETCSAPVGVATGPGAPTVPGGTLRGYGEFFAVQPQRIYDSRPNSGYPGAGQVSTPQSTRTVQVTGLGGVPSDAMMVALNVTVTEPTGSSFLTVYPTGAGRPTASNLNWGPGQVVPNLVNVRLGTGGRVDVYNNTSNAQVVIDVVGWYGSQATTARGGRLTTQTPTRVLDTRAISRVGPYGKVGQQQEITVQVAPAGSTGAVINLTGTEPTSGTFVTAWPADQARPYASSLNLVAGQTRPNLVMVKVSPQGTIKLFNNTGSTELIVDVVGTYGANSSNSQVGRVLPLTSPMRVLDTRITPGAHGPTSTRSYDMQVIDDATSASVAGFVMNVTATEGTSSTYLTVYPAGEGAPLASNLNALPAENIPNLVVNKLGTGDGVAVYNLLGNIQYIFDIAALVLA